MTLPAGVSKLVKAALKEDIGTRDRTSELIDRDRRGSAFIAAKEPGILAGSGIAAAVFRSLDRNVRVRMHARDGSGIRKGTKVLSVEGRLRAILTAERTALNFLGRLSGVATLTGEFVKRAGRVKVLDTRKTTPLLRSVEKYAVRMGGGRNHRMDLSSAVMIKDNHLAAAGHDWKRLAAKLKRIRRGIPVIVEVDRPGQLQKALALRPDVVLLDNMSVPQIKKCVKAVRRLKKRPELEVSGGVTLANIRKIASSGVDRISVGALTHSAPQLNFSLEVKTTGRK